MKTASFLDHVKNRTFQKFTKYYLTWENTKSSPRNSFVWWKARSARHKFNTMCKSIVLYSALRNVH